MAVDSRPTALRNAVWEQLEKQEAELVELCQRLVRIPSVNGVHPEESIADAIAEELKSRGVTTETPVYEAGRPNVLATLGHGEDAFLFVGHMDTVAVGDPNQWKHKPFSASIEDGLIFGRGTCDNKAGIAIAIVLLGTLKNFEQELDGRAVLCCVPDEESGATGRIGIKPLLRDNYLKASQAIYTYPGLDMLSIGHRGLLRVQVEAQGEAAHTGGEAWEFGEAGANAVTALAELLIMLEEWQPAYEPHDAFPGRRAVVTPGTVINGGTMESMVPAQAQAIVDVRMLPGQLGDDLLSEMKMRAKDIENRRRGIRFSWKKLTDLPAVSIPADSPIVKSLSHWTEELTGKRPETAGAGPANEGYLLIGAGIPTICGFGPPGGNAHAVDEYVEADGLVLTAKIYAAAVIDLLVPDSPVTHDAAQRGHPSA
jgi:succinyl-diaminopimelate desuccinylase